MGSRFYSSRWQDTRENILSLLSIKPTIGVRRYLTQNDVQAYALYSVQDTVVEASDVGEEGYSNLSVIFQVKPAWDLTAEAHELSLFMLNPYALYRTLSTAMMLKLYPDGCFPETIAIDRKASLIYLVRLGHEGYLKFDLFSEIESDKLETFLDMFVDSEPVRLDIEHEALLSVVDGTEGVAALRRGLCVVLNGGTSMYVLPDNFKDLEFSGESFVGFSQ